MFERHEDWLILCFKNSFPDLTCLISPPIFEKEKSMSLGSAHGQHFLKHKSLCLNHKSYSCVLGLTHSKGTEVRKS